MSLHLKRLFKGSAIYGIGGALSKFISILLLPIYTSFLTPKDYGTISILSLYSILLIQVFSLGLGSSIGIIYFSYDSKKIKNETIINSFYILLCSSLLMLTLSYIFIKPINNILFNSTSNNQLIILSVISTLFSIIVNPFILKLQFEEKQIRFVIITLFSSLISIIINIYLIVILKKGVLGFVEGMLLGQFLSFLLYFSGSLIKLNHSFRSFNIKLIKELIYKGLPLLPSFAAIYILGQGNIYFLKEFKSLDEVGIYSIGYNIGSAITLIITAFTTAWIPFFLSFINKRKEAEILFSKIFTYYLWVTGLLSLLFYLLAKPIIILFKPEFYNAYQVIGLTATSQILVGGILMPAIYFSKKLGLVTIFQLISTLLYVIMGILLIPIYGILGAAISLTLGYLFINLLIFYWNIKEGKKFLNIKYEYNRIVPFIIYYIFYIFISLFNIKLNLIVETFVLATFYIFGIILCYLLLFKSEKLFIKKIIKNIHPKRMLKTKLDFS